MMSLSSDQQQRMKKELMFLSGCFSVQSSVFCWTMLISAVGSVTIGKKMPQKTEGTDVMEV